MFSELKAFWTNLTNFKGRTRRREYWCATLWNVAIMYVLIAINMLIMSSGMHGGTKPSGISLVFGGVFSIIILVYSIAVLIGSISLCVRRCHDIGKKGIVYLFCILGSAVCGIGSIVWLVFACTPSKEDNEWGTNPKNDNTYQDNKSILLSVAVLIIGLIIYLVTFMNTMSNIKGLFQKSALQKNGITISKDIVKDTDTIQIDETTEIDLSGINEPVNETKDIDWNNVTFSIDKTEFSLPCKYEDLKKIGFQLDSNSKSAATQTIEPNEYTSPYYLVNDKSECIMVRFINDTDSTQTVLDCKICGVGIDEYISASPANLSILGVSQGINKIQTEKLLGTPSNKYDSDGISTYSSYEYKQGGNNIGKLQIKYSSDVANGIEILFVK